MDNILVLGENLRSMFDFEKQLQDKVHVVYNGLPFKLDDKYEGKPKNLPIEGKYPLKLLYLSNLIESKGYLDLLEAMNILVNHLHLRVECHFCGEFLSNPADDELVKSSSHGKKLFFNYINKHNLEDNVFFHGSIRGEEKIKMLNDSHFFILPTNYNIEGQPVSIIEAIAYGCVVISTNYRAIPDLVIEGKTGYFVPYKDPGYMAELIYNLISDPIKYHYLSNESIKHFNKNFTQERHLERLIPFLM